MVQSMTTNATTTNISIGGNVDGNIVVGDNNFVVNNNHGTIIYKQAAARVQARGLTPKPPRKPRSFIGRQRELTQLENWIASAEPVIVYGHDGLGKTTLTKQAANSAAAASLPNGVVFLEGVDEAGQLLGLNDIVQRLFDALFESDPPLKVDLVTARTYLSNVRPLVLLNSLSLPADNFEKLLDLFPSSPILIATEGMPRGDAYQTLPLPPLSREDALALLSDRSGLPLSEEAHPVFDAIADLLSDVPAALVMAGNAMREKGLGAATLLEGLRGIQPKSNEKIQAALERVQAWMWTWLSEEERGMMLQSAASPGLSVDRTWLESVAGGKSVSNGLESMELLQANSPRLRLMPGMRAMLLEQDIASARERLLAEMLSAMQERWRDFEFVKDELGNLLGLLNWCAEQKRWAEVIALGRALDPYLTLRGLWDAWHTTLEHVFDAARASSDRAVQGWVLHQLGTYHFGMGEMLKARTYLEQACSVRRDLGDEAGLAYSQHNLGLLPASGTGMKAVTPFLAGGFLPWLIGGLVTVAVVGAVALSGAFRSSPSSVPTSTVDVPPTAIVSTATSLVEATASPPAAMPTLTASSTPAPTQTETLKPPPPTAVPTYAILTGVVMSDDGSYCFYGPGRFYISLTGLIKGNPVQVTGRAEDLNWVYVNFPGVNEGDITRCWVQADTLQLSGEFSGLEVVYPNGSYHLPRSRFPALQNVIASRSGDLVTINWDAFDLPLGERESEKSPRYLIEAWLCKDGIVIFTPTPVYSLFGEATLTDEAGCTEPSHARVMLSEKHGYTTPVEVLWPPHTP